MQIKFALFATSCLYALPQGHRKCCHQRDEMKMFISRNTPTAPTVSETQMVLGLPDTILQLGSLLHHKCAQSPQPKQCRFLPAIPWAHSLSPPLCTYVLSCSVMSDSLQPQGLQPTRLFCPCNFPGKNAGEGCHSQPQGIVPGMELLLSSLLHWQVDSLVPPWKPVFPLFSVSNS